MIQTGSKFGNYKIIRQLGAGGMSDVYEAVDLTLERHVALKIMPPEFSQDEERIRRFRKEVLAVAALDHPGIVTIFEVNRAEGCDYYSMSLARHGNLKQLIHKGSLNPARSLQILRAVAAALGHAHDQGIVHRDIKPENILFARPDQPMLADFGIVKWLGSDTNITAVGTSVGTPYYMSPEQAQALKVDPRSDIYSLGVVLFEMLNGAVPFNATTTIGIALMHVNDPVPKLPGGLIVMQPLIERMMAKDPGERFQDCGELIRAIDRTQAALAQGARGDDAGGRAGRTTAPPPRRRSPKATVPPPAKRPKPTAPPPARSAKPTAPPPPKRPSGTTAPGAPNSPKHAPAVASPRDPATEFDLMVLTPDPADDSAPTTEKAEAEPTAGREARSSPAPPAGDDVAPARPGPEAEATPAARAEPGPDLPSSSEPTHAPRPRVATERPKPPRRRVNTGTPPPLARRTDGWQSREFYLPAGVPWYRRPLTYLIGSAVVAMVAVVLLLKMSMPGGEPSPIDLVTGRAAPGARDIGGKPGPRAPEPAQPAPKAMSGGDPQTPAAPPLEREPGAITDPVADTATAAGPAPRPEASRTEFLDQLPDETMTADARATPPEPASPVADGIPDTPDESASQSPIEPLDATPTTTPADAASQTQPAPRETAADVETARIDDQPADKARAGEPAAPDDSPAPESTERRIATLLADASRHRDADRLSPPGENAWESYQQVLELDPGNREARAGIADIEAAYRQLVRAALAAGNLDAAEVYLDRLRTVAPTDPDALALSRQWEAARAAASPAPGQELQDSLASGGDGPRLVAIGGGQFEMGAADGETSETPVHSVTVAAFALGKNEITVGQFEAFVTATGYRTTAELNDGCNYWLFGWRSGGDRHWRSPGFEQTESEPVVCVSRADARAYVDWLSAETGRRYALPSEAQWEYAASRGGAYWTDDTEACRSANVSDLTRAAEHGLEDDPANVFRCRDAFVTTAPVGSFGPDAAGLTDMLGNAGEWTADCAHPDYRGAPGDGSPRRDGDCDAGIVRGGSWYERPANVRPTKRFRLDADEAFSHIGFRVARED